MAGRVKVTFKMYWMEAVRSGEAIFAPVFRVGTLQYRICEVRGLTFHKVDYVVHHNIHP